MKIKQQLPEWRYWHSLSKYDWIISQQCKNQNKYRELCQELLLRAKSTNISDDELEDELLAIARVSNSLYYIAVYDELLNLLWLLKHKQKIVESIRQSFYESEALNPDIFKYFKRDIRIFLFKLKTDSHNDSQFLDVMIFYKKIIGNKSGYNHHMQKLIRLLDFIKNDINRQEVQLVINQLENIYHTVDLRRPINLHRNVISANSNYLFRNFKLVLTHPITLLLISSVLIKNLTLVKGNEQDAQLLKADLNKHQNDLELAMSEVFNLNSDKDTAVISDNYDEKFYLEQKQKIDTWFKKIPAAGAVGLMVFYRFRRHIYSASEAIFNIPARIKGWIWHPRNVLLADLAAVLGTFYNPGRKPGNNLEITVRYFKSYPFQKFTCPKKKFVSIFALLLKEFITKNDIVIYDHPNTGSPHFRLRTSALNLWKLQKLVTKLNNPTFKVIFEQKLMLESPEYQNFQHKLQKVEINKQTVMQLVNLFKETTKINFTAIQTRLNSATTDAGLYLHSTNKKIAKFSKQMFSIIDECKNDISRLKSLQNISDVTNNSSIPMQIENLELKLKCCTYDQADIVGNEIEDLKKAITLYQTGVVTINENLMQLNSLLNEIKNLNVKHQSITLEQNNNNNTSKYKKSASHSKKELNHEEKALKRKENEERKLNFQKEKEKRKLAKQEEEEKKELEQHQQEAAEKQKQADYEYERKLSYIKNDSRKIVAKDCFDILGNALKMDQEEDLIAKCKVLQPQNWQQLLDKIQHYCLLYNLMKMMHALGQLVNAYPNHIEFVDSDNAYQIRDNIMHFSSLCRGNHQLLVKFTSELVEMLKEPMDRLVKFGESHCKNIFLSLSIKFSSIINASSSTSITHLERMSDVLETAKSFLMFYKIGHLLQDKNYILLDQSAILLTAMRGCVFIIGSGLKYTKKANLQLNSKIYQNFVELYPKDMNLFYKINKTSFQNYRRLIGHFFTKNYDGNLKINREEGAQCLFEEIEPLQLEELAKSQAKSLVRFCNFVIEKIGCNNSQQNDQFVKSSKLEAFGA